MPEPETDALIRNLQQANRRWKLLAVASMAGLVLVLLVAAWVVRIQQDRIETERQRTIQALHEAQAQRDLAEQARQQAEEVRRAEEKARQEAEKARQEAEKAQRQEQQAKDQARRSLYMMQIRLATQQWEQDTEKLPKGAAKP
jgi:hypothetical protein